MKKLVALSVAVIMLFFGFAATADVQMNENGINVCEDIEPKPDPNDAPALI